MTDDPRHAAEIDARRKLGWPAWFAVVGMVLTTMVVLFAGLSLATLAGSMLGDSSMSLAASLIPVLLGGAACALVVMGLLRRSRTAWVIAFLLGAFTLYLWAELMLSPRTFTFEPIPILMGVPALMIVIGLAASWRDYWRHSAGSQEP